MDEDNEGSAISRRFRGYLPVVVDVETAGFDANRDALLEIAAVVIGMDDGGHLVPGDVVSCHVEPFAGANLDPKALEFNGIDPDHPFRGALPEREALDHVLGPVRAAVRDTGCKRAILVGHNAFFDLGFLNAAVARTAYKRNPFHPFSTLDTVSLAALAFGQTVLARSVIAAGLPWDANQAHSAVYDTQQTAALFCKVCNRWLDAVGSPTTPEHAITP